MLYLKRRRDMNRTIKTLLLCIGAGLLIAGAIRAVGEERFFGGGFDGCDKTSKAGMKISDALSSGTVFRIR